ncbi:FAM194 protein-domain-containing protein [Pavlovales sp. CCMP2436]|nr:FAM194 protein-domain-containing protein [Pavlovales sp. CCMP2436]
MPGKLGLISDTALLRAKNRARPLGPDSAGKSLVPYVSNDANATPVGAFHYYASGRLALFENRMYAGNYYWLYADNGKNTVLCQFDPLGQGHACYANGKLRLTSTKLGGRCLDENGSVLKSWTDKQPLKGDSVSFNLNGAASFSFKSRYEVSLKLTLSGQAFDFALGEQLAHSQGNYLSKKLGTHSLGPERGKAIVNVSTLDREKGTPDTVSLGRKTRVTEADFTIAALHPILRDADEMRVRVQGMLATPWIDSSLQPSRNFAATGGDPRSFNKVCWML